jgi:hypothetical protein
MSPPDRPQQIAKGSAIKTVGLDQVFLLEDEKTTLRQQCRKGFVTLVRYEDAPYAYVMRPSFNIERCAISEADFQTLEKTSYRAVPDTAPTGV